MDKYNESRPKSLSNERAFIFSGVNAAIREQCGRIDKDAKITDQYEQFLRSIPFTVFGTQTFRNVYKSTRIKFCTEKLIRSSVASHKQNAIAYIAVERGDENGRWHAHYLLSEITKSYDESIKFIPQSKQALFKNAGSILRTRGAEWYGFSDVRKINSGAQCIEYCAKYCLKSNNFDLYDFLIF